MKYVVDQINEQICVLEGLDDGDILEIDINVLPSGISEGSVLLFNDGIFVHEVKEEENRKESLRERMDRLKKSSE